METPDANGFVNITWPSNTIPHGGIFHTKVAESSDTQQKFLKVLLEESKLSIAQHQKCAWALRQAEKKEDQSKIHMPVARPRTSRRRSLSEIRESGVFEIEDYQPLKKGEDREKLKDKLASTMAYGDTTYVEQQVSQLPPRRVKSPPKLPTAKQMKHDLLTQIRERVEWLAEMEDLGEAGPHRDVIKDQIAERMRSLDALELSSECTSVRSSSSGFSTTRSTDKISPIQKTTRSNESCGKSLYGTNEKLKSKKTSARRLAEKEENTSVYSKLPILQYSPRRRV